jgi:hypothetical protein
LSQEEEFAEGMFALETIQYLGDLARRLSPGDDLPDCLKWEMREGCWWVMTDDGETGAKLLCSRAM